MEFWGLEVQPGQTVKVNPGENKYLHLSQISLGEVKKEKTAAASVFVKFDDKKLVLGTLSADKCSQIQSDLVFEKEFELFHGSKNTSVHFLGYKTAATEEDDDISNSSDGDSESDEEIPLAAPVNGKPEAKANDKAAKSNAQKAVTPVGKAKVKVEEPKKDDKAKDDEDDDDTEDDSDSEDDDDDDDDNDDVEMGEGEDDDSDDEDDSSDEEEDATPKKAEVGKKRPAGSASKTPVPEKKAKLISPDVKQKTVADGKKDGHVATPFPSKQRKTPANSDKSKQQTPKSSGSVACKSCSKTFNTENALGSHTKAKHSTGN
ncbi:histone deacetylase HDT2-like isoform X1 [Zingiber officinale]|uniref:histone deacetylase HDT2-like isoform X1 n=1 Tax=Zingiber officinale TaxID=94328 RepID=UPI001C4D863D|nr:histone deacetylase HDT2-like isoform X1 [Zingiber officinale]